MIRTLRPRKEEAFNWVVNKMEDSKFYSWKRYSIGAGIPIPKNGDKKDHRIWVQDRCMNVHEVNEKLRNRKLLIRIDTIKRKGVKKVVSQLVPSHVVRKAIEDIEETEKRETKRLDGLRSTPGISPENMKLLDRAEVLFDASKALLDQVIKGSKVLRVALMKEESKEKED
jgi:Arc/MetJ-type ribon-helix-helix transcriptional regulator